MLKCSGIVVFEVIHKVENLFYGCILLRAVGRDSEAAPIWVVADLSGDGVASDINTTQFVFSLGNELFS